MSISIVTVNVHHRQAQGINVCIPSTMIRRQQHSALHHTAANTQALLRVAAGS